MEDGSMANRNIVTDDGGGVIINVDNAIVLNVGVLADDNVRYIGPENGIGPDADSFFEDNPADDGGLFSDKSFRIDDSLS
jgi:hypothetical protein